MRKALGGGGGEGGERGRGRMGGEMSFEYFLF